MNDNDFISISKLLALLDIQDDDSFIITDINLIDNTKHLHIQKKLHPMYCPRCGSRMYSKGFYTRKLNHPVLQDSTKVYLIVKQRKWHCNECNLYMNDSFPFLERYSHSTSITPLLILHEFKHLELSSSSIAERFNISDTLAHIIFERYVDLPRLPLPEYILIDEVYMNISNSEKYAFVIMDFSNGEIVDIVHNRWNSTLERYFLQIPLKERLNVKAVICDAYQSYLSMPEKFFPNASTVLDSFHVVKVLISYLNNYINKVMKKYQERDKKLLEQKNHDSNRDQKTTKKSKEVILLQNYRWILLKNHDDINYSSKRYYHKILGMSVDTFTIEKMFLELDPNFKKLRVLKEDYIKFNNQEYESEFDVLTNLNALIDKYDDSGLNIFHEFSNFLKKNKQPIINSFICIKVHRKSARQEKEYYARLSNGPMESFNRKPKDLKRDSRGFSDFNYTRNRVLWLQEKIQP